MLRARFSILAAAMAAAMAGCGGGGGGGGGTSGVLSKPAGDFAAFLADGTESGRVELFVAEADGSNARSVSGGLSVLAGDVLDFAWSPNRERIAYRKDSDGDGHAELWVVDPAGGSPLLLYNPGAVLGADVFDFKWSPGSGHVAFRASSALVAPARLYVVPATGGTAEDISGSIVFGGSVDEGYEWRPIALYVTPRIAFRGNLLAVDRVDLFTNVLDGTDRQRMNPFTLNPTCVVEPDFAWSYNGYRVAFRGDCLLAGEVSLFTNAGEGGDQVVESEDVGAGHEVSSFRWSPTAMTIAYEHDAVTDGIHDLWTVASPGGAPVNRSSLPGPWAVSFEQLEWSPNGQWIAVLDDLFEYVRVFPAAGGSGPAVGHDALTFAWAPDSSAIAYVQDGMAYQTVIVVTPNGSDEIDLGDTQTTDSSVLRVTWSPDSARVAYVTDEGGDAAYDLRVATAEGGPSVLIHDSTALLNGVHAEAFAPNSEAIAFLGGSFFQTNVYTVLVDGTDEADLTESLLDTADAFDLQLK